ncbi:hypothetical protein [Mesorhizobium sp. B2-6-7]|uniref:hypothetical protein n=1 Tax=Mesorhizobium sp. B2-6-7 TaxID=2589910 RepID=UPI001126F33B|nr:hypothetical protein [Mesorhizobium sp. B2-6-7]TPJ70450.1 hypothetical protein FJ462_07070 [Mesorhizobium sp. B2-6-7]
MDGDLRSRMVNVEHKGAEHALRLSALETWKQQSDISDARKEEQWKAMNEKIDHVGKGVGEVQGTLKWIGRTIIGAIIVAFMAFLIKGGFAPN